MSWSVKSTVSIMAMASNASLGRQSCREGASAAAL
jgi:hypothetical protein